MPETRIRNAGSTLGLRHRRRTNVDTAFFHRPMPASDFLETGAAPRTWIDRNDLKNLCCLRCRVVLREVFTHSSLLGQFGYLGALHGR